MTKMTYAMAIENAINAIANIEGMDATVEKLQALQVSLAKRNAKGGERKPTKAQKENAELVEQMVEFLADEGAKTATEVAERFGISNQKASALLNRDSRVSKFTGDKRRTYFEVQGD